MTSLNELPTTAITLVFFAVVVVSGFLVLDGLQTEVACGTGYDYNETSQDCQLTSNISVTTEPTYAGNASLNIQSGLDNVTSYASTWGTIIGVAVLLAIVIGGFMFGRSRGYL